jgi:hypothetical protein
MTFLALTPVETAVLAVLTAGTVIALYFLKLRHRRIFVSSSLLWSRVLDEQQSHSLIEKLRRILSILIAVAIALLIAVSLARPEIEFLTGRNERIVIVLDTSPTMETLTGSGKTRWQRAVEEALNLLNSGGPTTEFRVADTSERTALSFTTDRNDARRLIRQMRPWYSEPHFPKVDARDSLVYFISDGVAVNDVPQEVKRISVFERAKNVGITAFEIRPVPSTPIGFEGYLEVRNFGPERSQASITLNGAGNQRINRTATIAPDGRVQEVFDLTRFEGGGIRASVQSKDDALAADDVAFAYLPIKRRTRTLLVTRGNSYLQTLLKLDSYVDLSMTDPANFRESPDIDAYIFDRFAPPVSPSRPALIIGAPNAAWLRSTEGVVQKPQITTWAEDHPVMHYVSVHDLSIERATRINPSNLTVIAASNQTPLIVVSEKPKWVMLTFDLSSSDFPFQTGFPVFIQNVLMWFSRDQVALAGSPGTVELPLANAQIRTIDGNILPAQQQLNKTVFEVGAPGLFTATQGDTRMHVAVNFANETFSDINRSSFRTGTAVSSDHHLLRRELAFYMLIAAILLLAVEWFTYHRRVTV